MNPTAPAAAGKRWIRRGILVGTLPLLLLAGGALLFFRRGSPPVPPVVSAEGIDPECACAIASARQKVVDDPYSAEAWGFLGKVLLANEQGRAADLCLHRAETMDPKEPRWPYYRGLANLNSDPPEAIACFRRAIACGDGPDADPVSPRMHLATLLLEEGRNDEAEAALKAIRAKEPDSPRTIYLSALLLANRNDLRGSILQLLRLTEQPTARHKASTRLAQLYLRLGDSAAAKKWDRIARSLPEDLSWREPYADELVQLAVGRGQRFKQVVRLQQQRRYAEAVTLLQEMIETDEHPVSGLYVDLGNNLVHLARGPEAEAAYQNALRLAPDDPKTHTRLALARLYQGEVRESKFGDREGAMAHYRRALESAREAVRLNPQLAEAQATLGQILLALGERRQAIPALKAALDSRPELSNVHLLLGNALAEEGRPDEALRHLRDAVRFADKDDGRAKAALERFEQKQKAKPVAP